MPFRVFQVPVRNSTPFEDQLNRFLASHSVLHVDRRFIGKKGVRLVFALSPFFKSRKTSCYRSAFRQSLSRTV